MGTRERGLTVSRSHVEFAVKGRCWGGHRGGLRTSRECALRRPSRSFPARILEHSSPRLPSWTFGRGPFAAIMSVILHIELSHAHSQGEIYATCSVMITSSDTNHVDTKHLCPACPSRDVTSNGQKSFPDAIRIAPSPHPPSHPQLWTKSNAYQLTVAIR